MPPIVTAQIIESKIEIRNESEKRHQIKVQTRDIIKMKRFKIDSKIPTDDRKALIQTKNRYHIFLIDEKMKIISQLMLLLIFKLFETNNFHIVFQETGSGNSESYGTSYFVNGGGVTSSNRSLEIILFVLILLFFHPT